MGLVGLLDHPLHTQQLTVLILLRLTIPLVLPTHRRHHMRSMKAAVTTVVTDTEDLVLSTEVVAVGAEVTVEDTVPIPLPHSHLTMVYLTCDP